MTSAELPGSVEYEAMLDAAAQLDVDFRDARLVSSSSRMMWHLPRASIALAISRAGDKSADDVIAESYAVRAACEAGVRTPPLVAEPLTVAGLRHVLAFEWIDGRPALPEDWTAAVVEAAKLMQADRDYFRSLQWPTDWPRNQWSTILRRPLFDKLAEHSRSAGLLFSEMMRSALVPAHCDLQPANFLIDRRGRAWVIDLEYASLAPLGWDAAKLIILSRRFGDPANCDALLRCWPSSTLNRINEVVLVQEVLLVGWLADMALKGSPGAQVETYARTASLGAAARWRHLQ